MNLYIYIEIFNREFLSKFIIGMESASKGLNVYIGRIKPYLIRDFFAPGVILLKSITPSSNRIKQLEYYKSKNFIITSLDEEVGLLNRNINQYLKLRYSHKTVQLVDKIFTWGKFDYDNLCKKFKNLKKKFVFFGPSKKNFWKKKFKNFFKKKKSRKKKYILFSLNFSYLFSEKEFDKHLILLKKNDYPNRGYTIKKIKKLRKDSYKMLKEFSKLIIALSKKINLKIVVRPHPTNDLKIYSFLKKFKNIEVNNKGNISEWIYNSRLVIHSGCTGGLESSIRGYPTISYTPFKSSTGHKFANIFSKKFNNLKKCINFIDKELKKDLVIDRSKLNLDRIRSRASNLFSKKPAFKIISYEFLKLLKKKRYKQINNDLYLKFIFKLRDFRSSILRLNYGNRKFEYFNKFDVLNDFEILKKINPKYQNLKINFLKKDIIQIKRIN